ncbi:class I SAM-dependent methyltransferase [Nocardia inohanensis]|uniref:class I SAM-dependent methyltransferase n=1 Tax=Nocardia inohanensis TaxID=209246 RepID=UPI00082BF6F3|nr:SAM-dependent methyltransferase [Nocardia inohanensis]
MDRTAGPISNVSDTARWVAAYRAIESARTDALFHDPLAERLAGETGKAIVANENNAMAGWPLITRTKVIDDLIAETLTEGCDLVINMAAGLDARPYRLDLPADLRWIEADFPDLIAEKNRLLEDETPRCVLTRAAVDLADPAARDEFLNEALAGVKKALVLTEGLVYYLSEDEVSGLAAALARPEIHWWIMDVNNKPVVDRFNRVNKNLLENSPWKFGPLEPLRFFADAGWTADEVVGLFRMAARFRRLPPLMWPLTMAPVGPRRPIGGKRLPWYAAVRLTYTGA